MFFPAFPLPENTASRPPNALSLECGQGLLQVDLAVNYLKSFSTAPEADVNFKLSVATREGRRGAGVYLREPWEVAGET